MGPVTNIGPITMSWGPKDGTITSRAGDDLVGRELHIRYYYSLVQTSKQMLRKLEGKSQRS